MNSIALTRDETKLVSGSVDKTLKLWNFKTKECLVSLHGHSADVNSVQITPDGQYAISGSKDRTVKVWDLASATCVGTLEGHQNTVQSVAISPDGRLVASTGFQDYTVRLWDWQIRVCIEMIEFKLPIAPSCVAFSPDGLRLIVGTTEGQIYVYRLTEA